MGSKTKTKKGTPESVEGAIVTDYLKQYTNMPKRTLARLIYAEVPGVFKDIDQIRTMIRYRTKALGSALRDQVSEELDCSEGRPEATETNPFRLPEGPENGFEPFIIPTSYKKMLSLFDIHFPYHSKEALELALQYGLDQKCDSILLGGDIMDCYKVSRFEKDPRERGLAGEIEMVHMFLTSLREAFPDAKIIWKEGNHEARIPKAGMSACPELFGANFIRTLDEVLELDLYGIKWVPDKRPMQFGKLNVMHGDEYGGRSGGVNPARNMFLKTRECCLTGHWHRSDNYVGKTLRDRPLSCWSVGCLCELHPAYCPANDWVNGFAVIERDPTDDDWFEVQNKRIVKGRVV